MALNFFEAAFTNSHNYYWTEINLDKMEVRLGLPSGVHVNFFRVLNQPEFKIEIAVGEVGNTRFLNPLFFSHESQEGIMVAAIIHNARKYLTNPVNQTEERSQVQIRNSNVLINGFFNNGLGDN